MRLGEIRVKRGSKLITQAPDQVCEAASKISQQFPQSKCF